jgi:prepilin-type N-terminal cleavage/methylation domain-containing protein
MAEPRRDGGFTLVEVLVALAVVGLVLGAVYRLYGTGVLTVGRAASQLELALAAEALLERTRADLDPRGAGVEGRIGADLRFRLSASPLPPPPAPARRAEDGPPAIDDPSAPRERLWLVRVDVADPDGRIFTLSTLRWLPERGA